MLHSVHIEHVGMIAVELRQRANSVGREKLALVQHELENAAQLVGIGDGQQSSFAHAPSLHAAMLSVRSGRFSMNHSSRRLNPGSLSRTSGSRVSTANSGINPTMERILMGN